MFYFGFRFPVSQSPCCRLVSDISFCTPPIYVVFWSSSTSPLSGCPSVNGQSWIIASADPWFYWFAKSHKCICFKYENWKSNCILHKREFCVFLKIFSSQAILEKKSDSKFLPNLFSRLYSAETTYGIKVSLLLVYGIMKTLKHVDFYYKSYVIGNKT